MYRLIAFVAEPFGNENDDYHVINVYAEISRLLWFVKVVKCTKIPSSPRGNSET